MTIWFRLLKRRDIYCTCCKERPWSRVSEYVIYQIRVKMFFVLFCLFLTLALYSKTSVGARGHTTGRILRRLETERKYGTYTPWSKLPPLEACVTLVLNQSRLHTTRKKIKRRYRKTSRTRYCASAAGNNRYKPDGFPHPPTTPEGSVSGCVSLAIDVVHRLHFMLPT